MKISRICILLAAAALSACAGTPAPKAAVGAVGAVATVYYFGPVLYFSPDGKIPYNNTQSAVIRMTSADRSRIIETVTQPGWGPSMPSREYVTELRRRDSTLVYDAADAGGSFTGTVTFKDSGLKSWDYDIRLKDGGTIKGTGEVSPEGLRTEKQLGGIPRPMLIKEDLKMVSEEGYRARLKEMLPPRGAE